MYIGWNADLQQLNPRPMYVYQSESQIIFFSKKNITIASAGHCLIIIKGRASNLMKIANISVNALPDEQWKCNMILELTDCIYGFSNCGLSYEEAKYCLCHVASD